MPGDVKKMPPGYNAPVTRGEVNEFARFCKLQANKSNQQFWRDTWYRLHEVLLQTAAKLPEVPTAEVHNARHVIRAQSGNYRYGGKQ